MAAPPLPRCSRCGTLPSAGGVASPCPRCGTPPGAPARGPGTPGPLRALLGPLRGAAFLSSHPRLLPWILLPLAVNLLLLLLLVGAALAWAGDLAPTLGGAWPAWVDGLRGPVEWSLRNLARLLAVGAALLLTLALSGAVNAPFHDALSERTEAIVLGSRAPGAPGPGLLADALRSVAAALWLLLVQAAVLGPLFLLSFTALGAPLFAAAGTWFAGLGLADVVLGRKGYGGRERIRWGRRRWPAVLALGAPVVLLPLLQPLAVVGGTLLFLEDPDKAA